MPAQSKSTRTRAEINRANAQKSTGPRTPEGKAASSQNAFKHGLSSKLLVVPGEDPAELDQIRASYRAEHQPAGITEETLVDELAQHFWRMRRLRNQETGIWERCYQTAPDYALITLVQRALNSADRAWHRTLKALKQLQKDRGFVPQNGTPTADSEPRPQGSVTPAPQTRAAAASGFVSENSPESSEITESLINEVLELVESVSAQLDTPLQIPGFDPELNA